MNAGWHIAVVGAGIAGLSCAEALRRANIRVTIFDKSKGPAGRMSTRRGESWECDHGAQYFTARDPAFRAEVARWEAEGVAGVWQPRLKVFEGAVLQDRASSVARYVGIPRMTSPAQFIAREVDLVCQTTVQAVEQTDEGWSLTSAECGCLDQRFDAVLLALPAPQGASLLDLHAPEFVAVAQSATMRGSWAMMLRYTTPLDLGFDAVFVNDGPLRWVARNSSKPGRRGDETWLLHASALWSEAHLDETAESVAPLLLAEFARLGAPAPAAWTAHRWRYADTEPPLTHGCLWNSATRIGLCGDWLNGGKVEGAWLSGRALAERVIAEQ